MHSSASGTMARIVLRSESSVVRRSPFTLERYASIVAGLLSAERIAASLGRVGASGAPGVRAGVASPTARERAPLPRGPSARRPPVGGRVLLDRGGAGGRHRAHRSRRMSGAGDPAGGPVRAGDEGEALRA